MNARLSPRANQKLVKYLQCKIRDWKCGLGTFYSLVLAWQGLWT